MGSILKRFGVVGVVLLVLNEIRGVMVAAAVLAALFGVDNQADGRATPPKACADCAANVQSAAGAVSP